MFLMAAGYSGEYIEPECTFVEVLIPLPAGFALTAVWVANVIPRPPAKRSAAIGIVNGIGNMGNL